MMADQRTAVGTYIRNSRMQDKVTQDRLARMVDIPRSRLCAIERGETQEPSGEVLARLCSVMGLSPVRLLNTCLPSDFAPIEPSVPYLSITAEVVAAGVRRLQSIRDGDTNCSGDEDMVAALFRDMALAAGAVAKEAVETPSWVDDTGRLPKGWDKLPT